MAATKVRARTRSGCRDTRCAITSPAIEMPITWAASTPAPSSTATESSARVATRVRVPSGAGEAGVGVDPTGGPTGPHRRARRRTRLGTGRSGRPVQGSAAPSDRSPATATTARRRPPWSRTRSRAWPGERARRHPARHRSNVTGSAGWRVSDQLMDGTDFGGIGCETVGSVMVSDAADGEAAAPMSRACPTRRPE